MLVRACGVQTVYCVYECVSVCRFDLIAQTLHFLIRLLSDNDGL